MNRSQRFLARVRVLQRPPSTSGTIGEGRTGFVLKRGDLYHSALVLGGERGLGIGDEGELTIFAVFQPMALGERFELAAVKDPFASGEVIRLLDDPAR